MAKTKTKTKTTTMTTTKKPRTSSKTSKTTKSAQSSSSSVSQVHNVTAGRPVTYKTSGHPPRADSPTYKVSRSVLDTIRSSLEDWYFPGTQYQDHHGGGLWMNDGKGWFFVRNLVGIEWSGQFCADPKKVDVLRQNAQRLYARFPESFEAFDKLGIDLKKLLNTPITDAAGVGEWTDSICNASVPLPQVLHTGFVPKGGGVHNYPTPVTDIDRFRYDDFQLWVTDSQGQPAAVVPVSPRGSGDSRVRVVNSTAGTKLYRKHVAAESKQQYLELPGDHPLAKQAFKKQKGSGRKKG
jgi:hypothetical protein